MSRENLTLLNQRYSYKQSPVQIQELTFPQTAVDWTKVPGCWLPDLLTQTVLMKNHQTANGCMV